MSLGGGEIILICFVVLLLFGARKLPEFAKSLGTGIKEFKKSINEVREPLEETIGEINNNKTSIESDK